MNFVKLLFLGAATVGVAACTPDAEDVREDDRITAEGETTDVGGIVAVAQGNENFGMLATAVGLSDLGTDLVGPGPFTVFGPTDTAFEKIDADTLSGLLNPDDNAQLNGILRHHVVEGRMSAEDIATAIREGGGTATLTTLGGGTLTATMMGDDVLIEDGAGNNATVTITDVEAENGVIHAIDTVLMPG